MRYCILKKQFLAYNCFMSKIIKTILLFKMKNKTNVLPSWSVHDDVTYACIALFLITDCRCLLEANKHDDKALHDFFGNAPLYGGHENGSSKWHCSSLHAMALLNIIKRQSFIHQNPNSSFRIIIAKAKNSKIHWFFKKPKRIHFISIIHANI